jgi:threonine/homoserine/homoserine lactone efflux protein
VTRITTPFDNFMSDLSALWSEFWMLGVIALGIAVIIATAALVTRSRARAKFREPQYRRHTYWE